MSEEEPTRIHPFFEKVRQASSQPNVIVPQIVSSPERQHHGSETELNRLQHRKRQRESVARCKNFEELTYNNVSSTEDSKGNSLTPTSSDDKPESRRRKRRKGANSSLLSFRPESIAEYKTDTSCRSGQSPAASEHGRIELAEDGEGASRVSPSADIHPTSLTSTCHDSATKSETVIEQSYARVTDVSPPTRKSVKLHLSRQLLSSPTRHSRLPSPPDQSPNDNMEKRPIAPMLQQRRTLRINQNGKLLSSPPPSVQEDSFSDSLDKKESKRLMPRRKNRKRSHGTQRSSLVVKLKYGVDDISRKHIGHKVENIIRGSFHGILPPASPSITANPREADHQLLKVDNPAPQPQPPKPLHPFFLPKQAHGPPDPILHAGDKQIPAKTVSLPKLQIDRTLPVHPTKPTELAAKPSSVRLSGTWPILRSKSPRYSDLKHALWPSQGLMHVRGLDNGELPTFDDLDLKPVKGKGTRNRVDDQENIIAVISKCLRELHREHESRSKTLLRRPKQQHWTGDELERVVGGRITTVHPAVVGCREDIKSVTNAFERGTCEDNLWTAKYAPSSTKKVLQDNNNISILSEWLKTLTVYTVQKEAAIPARADKYSGKDTKKRKKKRKRKAKSGLDDFVVSDDSEEEKPEDFQLMYSNLDDSQDELGLPITTLPKKIPVGPPKKAILVTGPTGCGKTASVYAAAKEMGFEVFEMNAGSKRSGKDIIERVGDMARNHLVQLEKQLDGAAAIEKGESQSTFAAHYHDAAKQKIMGNFLKASSSKQDPHQAQLTSTKPQSKSDELQEDNPSQSRVPTKRQKQSLILLDDVDVLFEEDKQFWTGVLALLKHSKRPIIMTCTNESSIPFAALDLEAAVHVIPPSPDIVADYCLAIAAQEGHLLKHDDVESLYQSLGNDLRATLMTLNFWCQMGIGSEKAGLDWRPDQKLIYGTEEEKQDVRRTISDGGYVKGLESLNHDISTLSEKLEKELVSREESLTQWSIGVMDWEEREVLAEMKQDESLDAMQTDTNVSSHIEDHLYISEMRSCLDMFCAQASEIPLYDKLDCSWPEMSQKQRCNYTEAYPLIQADPEVEYSSLTTKIGSAFSVFLGHLNPKYNELEEQSIMKHTIPRACTPSHAALTRKIFYSILEPICREDSTMYNYIPGRQSFSFDREVSVTAEDIAPYIRSIIHHDEECIRRRDERLREDAKNNVKRRTTRSSMAAADGDGIASRRENYITRHNELVPVIFETAGPSWQSALEKYMSKLPPIIEVPIYERNWVWVHETPEDYQER
ncbi:hypothetical protein KEM54_006059 [Ascosphaera aggregata]|nr:hypothetical protein KEM54_006059 [Ascosphaera aggregata]